MVIQCSPTGPGRDHSHADAPIQPDMACPTRVLGVVWGGLRYDGVGFCRYHNGWDQFIASGNDAKGDDTAMGVRGPWSSWGGGSPFVYSAGWGAL